MKHYIRILILLLIFIFVFQLSACTYITPKETSETPVASESDSSGDLSDDSSNQSTDDSSDETDTPVQAKEKIVLASNQKTTYSIVYPANASEALISAAETLKAAFLQYAGVDIALVAEKGTGKFTSAEEILLGNTRQATSDELYSEIIDPKGYSVFTHKGKLVLYSEKDSMVLSAVNNFIKEILSKAENPKEHFEFTSNDNFYYKRSGVIASALIGGTELENFRIVYPENGYVERELATLFVEYLKDLYIKTAPEIVSDTTSAKTHEILIGNTNRSASKSVAEGTYKIALKRTKLTVACGNPTSYIDMLPQLRKLINTSNLRSEVTVGTTISGKLESTVQTADADIKVMFHNVLGYLSQYPASSRPAVTLQIYLEHSPDVIGMQEVGETHYRSHASKLFNGLKDAGYTEIVFHTIGTGNPIFYNSQKLELLESGYVHARSDDKGTTYAVFKVKETGKKFAVFNSHFAANSNANGDKVLGNTYRVQDADTMLNQLNKIKSAYPDIPIITGGDFNSNATSDPYKRFIEGGLLDAVGNTKISPSSCPATAYPTYDKETGIYSTRAVGATDIKYAIDRVMLGGSLNGINPLEYVFLDNRVSTMVSDHFPHMLLFDWK